MPDRAAWGRFIETALDALATEAGVEFPTGDTHDRGVFPLGIRARYRGREFSLWCDQAGELIVVHDRLRAQQVEDLCMELVRIYAE